MAFDDTYRLSAHAIITDDQNRVLQLRATYGEQRWGLPGGALDPGETIHDALKRECHEELGVWVEVLHLTGVYHHRSVNSHAFIFRCALPTNAILTLSAEHSAFEWFSIHDLSEVQARRVQDSLCFDGRVVSAVF